jgi:hypothetical protein
MLSEIFDAFMCVVSEDFSRIPFCRSTSMFGLEVELDLKDAFSVGA